MAVAAAKLLSDSQIVQAIELASNEEAFKIISDLLNNSDLLLSDFAKELKEIFPEVDLTHSTRVKDHCKTFLKEYKNKIISAKLKATRNICITKSKLDFVDCYKVINAKQFTCNSCELVFEGKKMVHMVINAN